MWWHMSLSSWRWCFWYQVETGLDHYGDFNFLCLFNTGTSPGLLILQKKQRSFYDRISKWLNSFVIIQQFFLDEMKKLEYINSYYVEQGRRYLQTVVSEFKVFHDPSILACLKKEKKKKAKKLKWYLSKNAATKKKNTGGVVEEKSWHQQLCHSRVSLGCLEKVLYFWDAFQNIFSDHCHRRELLNAFCSNLHHSETDCCLKAFNDNKQVGQQKCHELICVCVFCWIFGSLAETDVPPQENPA